MKPVMTCTLLFLLAFMVACGKDNKSGKNNFGAYGLNALGSSGYYNGGNITGVAYNGVSIQQIINENPCVGQNYSYSPTARLRMTTQANLGNNRIPVGDVYVGVSFGGDVAVLVGTENGPVFEAYVCPGSYYGGTSQTSSPYNITLLSYSTCRIKQMNANLQTVGRTILFGSMQGGSSQGQVFSACR